MAFNTTVQLVIAISAAMGLVGCGADGENRVETAQSYAGWYMEQAGQGMFQLCGQSHQLRVTALADIPSRARDFGLDPDTPVYARLVGSVRGGEIKVSRVEQFGSQTPIRDCAMTGVVIPAPAGD